jgi:hypothetical protein
MIYSQKDIQAALVDQAKQFDAYIKPMEEMAFENMPGGKWSAGQHLDHLVRSIKPVNLALTLPGFILKYKFGTNNRAGRTYDELAQRYYEKLQAGGTASGEFVPPPIGIQLKDRTLSTFVKQYEKLGRKALTMSDSKLDTLLVPHPLLGKVTLREILFFTIFHTQVHLDILKKR